MTLARPKAKGIKNMTYQFWMYLIETERRSIFKERPKFMYPAILSYSFNKLMQLCTEKCGTSGHFYFLEKVTFKQDTFNHDLWYVFMTTLH